MGPVSTSGQVAVVAVFTVGLMVFIWFAAHGNSATSQTGKERGAVLTYTRREVIRRASLLGVAWAALIVFSPRDGFFDVVEAAFALSAGTIFVFCSVLRNMTRRYVWDDEAVEMWSVFDPLHRFPFAALRGLYHDTEDKRFVMDFGKHGKVTLNDDYEGSDALVTHARGVLGRR